MSEPDEALVLMAQRGDRTAFEEMVRRCSRLVFTRLYLETGDPHRAEDLLQETLLRAYNALDRLTHPNLFRSWLLTIAQNVLTDSVRRESRLKRAAPPRAGPGALAALASSGPLPEEQAERAELREQLLSVLRSLPEEYRVPLSLRYLAGADYDTIAGQLGLS